MSPRRRKWDSARFLGIYLSFSSFPFLDLFLSSCAPQGHNAHRWATYSAYQEVMTDIIVELRESSSEGRLYYKPDLETKQHLLLVASSQSSRWAYSVNLDGGSLLLDFNAQRKLVNIELGIPRNHWQKLSSLPSPIAAESADIFLRGVASYHGKWKHPHIRRRSSDSSAIRIYGYEHQVVVITNRELSAVQISLGSPDKLSRWISLSEHCWAQVAENRLKGFFVKLSG